MNVPLWLWFAVLGLILVMLAIDLFAHRHAKVIEFKEAAGWSLLWITLGLAFGVYIWFEFGAEFGQQYFSGFVIEKSLAVDNVFVWALIFAAFSVPREYQHRVLFLGVLGALDDLGDLGLVLTGLPCLAALIEQVIAARLLLLSVLIFFSLPSAPLSPFRQRLESL